MEHQTAASGLTERYLLGELGEEEREAFEEHFFECPTCAEDVKAAAAIVDGVRSNVVEVPAGGVRPGSRAPRRGLFWPMPLGAAAALALSLGVVAYQGLRVIPGLRTEIREAERLQAPPSYFLYASRSAPPVLAVPAGGRRLLVRLSATFEHPFARYRCRLQDAAGRSLQDSVLVAPPTGEELQIQLSVRGLASGPYELVLDGLDAQDGPPAAPDLARYRFTLHHEEE